MTLLLRGCNIVDATSPEPRPGSYVLINGEVILEVGNGTPPDADNAIDLDDAYLLPGLWDVHAHLRPGTWDGVPSTETPTQAALSQGRAAMDALSNGVTGLRVVGIEGWADVAWRDAFDDALFDGPRLVCCGKSLGPSAGHSATLGLGGTPGFGVADGPEDFIRSVRVNIKNGVDQIKLITTGGIMGAGHDRMPAVMMLRDEIEAAIRIATQRGLPVATHATSPDAVKWAVEAGTNSIEHGYTLDEEAAALMADRGVYYVPTLALSHLTADQAATTYERAYCEANPLPQGFRERANHFAPVHEESFRLALDAGVKIASGSDQGPPKEAALLEIDLLSRLGLGPHGAIAAATLHAAELCQVADRVGTVEPGKLADLIVVVSNPLDDIHALRDLRMVLKEGRSVFGG